MQNPSLICEERRRSGKGQGAAAPEAMDGHEPATTVMNARILVVDDQALLREAVAFEFEMLGCKSLQAENGEMALRLFKETKPDVIISDIRMPGWDGVRLLDEIRRIAPHLPAFIFMTGFSDLQLPMAFQRGADAFLSKPLYPESLESTLKRLLVPIEKRWRHLSSERPIFNVAARLTSLADAAKKREVLFGRRGFFLNQSLLPKTFVSSTDRLVAFKLSIAEGPMNLLEGIGRVRWVREQADTAPAGLGIEFEFLAEPGREQFERHVLDRGVIASIPDGSVQG